MRATRANRCQAVLWPRQDGKYILFRREHFAGLETQAGDIFRFDSRSRHEGVEMRREPDDTAHFSVLHHLGDARRIFSEDDYEAH